jgi:hypothetical protein
VKKVLCALLLAGCGGVQNLGSRVQYLLSEEPLASGKAGSCMSEAQADYESLRNLKWAMGTDLQVHLDWPDRKDCHSEGIVGPIVCENVQVELRPVGSAWREHDMSDNPAPRFIINLQSVSDGQGGLKTVVRGQEFDPPLLLETNRASAIWFEQAKDSRYGDVVPGAISEIHVSRGAWAIVAATLRDASGEHICGAVPAAVGSAPTGLFLVEPLRETPYANLPFKITAGSSAGAGSFDVAVGDLAASLRVIVE